MDEFPQVRFDEQGSQIPFTEQEVDTLVPMLAQHYAPRRFALCDVVRDADGLPYDVHVIAWGIQTGLEDDSVSVFGYPDESGRSIRCSFSSADLAVRVLSGADDVRLAWVDADTLS